MSITINTNTYAGKFAQEYLAKSLLGGKTLGGNHLTIKANIKNKLKLTIADSSTDLIQAYSCAFNAKGTVTLGERVLEPAALKVNWEQCKRDLIQTWASELMLPGASNSTNPKEFNDFLVDRIQTEVATEIDYLIWNGDSASTAGIVVSAFDGFMKIAANDPNTVKVTGTTVTSSNVLAELDKVFLAIPDTIFDDVETLKWFVSRNIYRAFGLYQNTYFAANSNYSVNAPINYVYRGIELIPVSLAPNKMFVSRKENLFFGTDLESDLNEYYMVDMSQTTGDDKLRMIMNFSGGVQYSISQEVVIYN